MPQTHDDSRNVFAGLTLMESANLPWKSPFCDAVLFHLFGCESGNKPQFESPGDIIDQLIAQEPDKFNASLSTYFQDNYPQILPDNESQPSPHFDSQVATDGSETDDSSNEFVDILYGPL